MTSPRFVKQVIALPDSTRVAGFLSQPAANGFQVAPAFDGRGGEVPSEFNVEGYRLRYGRLPLGGEVGCAVSHYRVIRDFAASDHPVDTVLLIAEDDARFSIDPSAAVVRAYKKFDPSTWCILADSTNLNRVTNFASFDLDSSRISWLAPVVAREGSKKYRIGDYFGDCYCTALYAMTKLGAVRYVNAVNRSEGLSWNADDYQHIGRIAGVRVIRAYPTLATFDGASTIRSSQEISSEWSNSASTWRRCVNRLPISMRTKVTGLVHATKMTKLRMLATASDLRARASSRTSRRHADRS